MNSLLENDYQNIQFQGHQSFNNIDSGNLTEQIYGNVR